MPVFISANLRLGSVLPWVVMGCLWATPALPEHSHSDHAPHAGSVIRLSLTQALELGAQRGPEVTRVSATRGATKQLAAVAAPTFTQLPFVQAQIGPRLSRDKVLPEFIVSANQPFTWGDVSGAQRRVSNATGRALETETAHARLNDAERAAHAWIELALAERVLALRKDFVALAESLAAVANARVSAGEAQPMERALSQSELASAQSELIDAEGSHFAAELELAYALGVTTDVAVHINGALMAPEALVSSDSRGVHPEVEAAENRAHLALQQVEYAAVQQAPVVSIGVQYQREGTGDQILTAVATLPLPIARPWAFQQAEQKIASDAARAEAQLARVLTAKRLKLAQHEVAHAESQYDHLAEQNLPALREAQRMALARYTAGEEDLTSVSLIRQRWLRAEEQLATALAELNHAHIRLQAARGSLLDSKP